MSGLWLFFLLLFFLFCGYAWGRRQGQRKGKQEGMAEAKIRLRQESILHGACPICDGRKEEKGG